MMTSPGGHGNEQKRKGTEKPSAREAFLTEVGALRGDLFGATTRTTSRRLQRTQSQAATRLKVRDAVVDVGISQPLPPQVNFLALTKEVLSKAPCLHEERQWGICLTDPAFELLVAESFWCVVARLQLSPTAGPLPGSDDDFEHQYLQRMSTPYVRLFSMVPTTKRKDEIFSRFPEVWSATLLLALLKSFPDSHFELEDPSFGHFLLHLCNGWTCGCPPPKEDQDIRWALSADAIPNLGSDSSHAPAFEAGAAVASNISSTSSSSTGRRMVQFGLSPMVRQWVSSEQLIAMRPLSLRLSQRQNTQKTFMARTKILRERGAWREHLMTEHVQERNELEASMAEFRAAAARENADMRKEALIVMSKSKLHIRQHSNYVAALHRENRRDRP
jgi:hypothetical protein